MPKGLVDHDIDIQFIFFVIYFDPSVYTGYHGYHCTRQILGLKSPLIMKTFLNKIAKDLEA